MKITNEWIDISHSIGAPFGGMGTGYGVLGKYGFVLPNFNSTPCVGRYDRYCDLPNYDYLDLHGNDRKNFLRLHIKDGKREYAFQSEALDDKLRFSLLINASMAMLGFNWNDIVIAYIGEGYEKYEGKTVAQIAKEMGKSSTDAYLDLCEMSEFKGRVNMGPYSTPAIVSELSRDPVCLYMTDAWVEPHGVQNPAIYDCFPKFLKYSLNGTGDTMPNTIRKMTGGVADRFSIKDRGYVRAGCYADLTVFNEEALKTGEEDHEHAFGIEKVFINGALVLDGDTLNEEAIRTSGRALRAN